MGRRSFDALENVRLLVPTFTITTDHPLVFGTPDDVERWRAERGVLWALGGADDPDAPAAKLGDLAPEPLAPGRRVLGGADILRRGGEQGSKARCATKMYLTRVQRAVTIAVTQGRSDPQR